MTGAEKFIVKIGFDKDAIIETEIEICKYKQMKISDLLDAYEKHIK